MSSPSDQPPAAPAPVRTDPLKAQGSPFDAPAVSAGAPAEDRRSWAGWLAVLALLAAAAAIAVAWQSRERLQHLEAELVRRQQASADAVAEARLGARQAQELAREAAARAQLQELRLVELNASRDQLDDVLQAVTRSRDENLLAELDAALRAAVHQAAITGSADAVVLTLRYAEDRLARASGPAIDRVRRAILTDLERVTAGGPADPTVLADRLDELLRGVDGLPLLSEATAPAAAASAPTPSPPRRPRAATAVQGAAATASAPASAPPPDAETTAIDAWRERARQAWHLVWDEARALVRLTPVDHPDAALLAPEQAVFVRQNLQLRLLGARVAVLSRRFDSAQVDLAAVRELLERYFDRRARSVQAALEVVRQVGAQARAVPVPRPEATQAALAAAGAPAPTGAPRR